MTVCHAGLTASGFVKRTLLALLDGSTVCSALRNCGRFAPIQLPADEERRAALVVAHMHGAPLRLTFRAEGREPWDEEVKAVILAPFCPDGLGQARWIGVDQDASDHGARGLAEPVHAARCIAEAADRAGLLSGLLVARSRGGRGRHAFLILPAPVPLRDAVLGIAALVAAAYRTASSDVALHQGAHAFRRVDESIARPGDPGAVELIPRSTARPRFGWSLVLPAGGAFADKGGGVIVDPFDNTPLTLTATPRCDSRHWTRFVAEAGTVRRQWRPPPSHHSSVDVGRSLNRISEQTKAFIHGDVSQGTRNVACFAAACNLIGVGVAEPEAERLILTGAAKCGLAEREARVAFASAVGTVRRRRRS